MRFYLLLLVFIIFQTTIVNAQESAGFSDSENIEPLLEYRLPAWGYSNLFWDFSFLSNLQGIDNQNGSRTFGEISGSLSPTYNYFFESEKRVSNRSFSPSIDYSRENLQGFTENENSTKNIELGLNWILNERFYLNQQNIFILGNFQGMFTQNHFDQFTSTNSNLIVTDFNRLTRNLTSTLGTGVGFGRIRNVNPMIRSLRFQERLNDLSTEEPFTLSDLRSASEQFTKVNGYSEVYDRPEKYFWRDMDSQISTELMAFEPFDLFYLTDVLSESIGQRLEGWEIIAKIDLNHFVGYTKAENHVTNIENSQIFRSTYLIPSILGRWYKNLDLKNQVGLTAQFSHYANINSQNDITYTSLNTRAEWLHTITDRFLAQPYVSYERIMNDFNNSSLSAGASLNYFIENNLSLFSTLQYSYAKNEQGNISESRNRLQINAGIRYYMNRGLF